jgi:hypothetical protein
MLQVGACARLEGVGVRGFDAIELLKVAAS